MKASAQEVARETYPTEITLEIRGLRQISEGIFALVGVRPVEIPDMVPIIEGLVAQGISLRLAERLVDEAHSSIGQALLADALAQRASRIN